MKVACALFDSSRISIFLRHRPHAYSLSQLHKKVTFHGVFRRHMEPLNEWIECTGVPSNMQESG